jgi:tetratricopeptide (TPR) repeat protein
VIVIALFTGCSGTKQLTQYQASGEKAYEMGDYGKALAEWEKVIDYYSKQGTPNECPVYAEAAAAAIETGQVEKAIQYLVAETYTGKASGDTYLDLAVLYQQIDNLSKEIDALDAYIDKFPEGEKAEQVRVDLFEIYVESKNWEAAQTEYNNLSDASKDAMIEPYFVLNEALKNDSVCDALALEMLDENPENVLALDWMAKKLFWQAEKRYQDEMKAYSENKTNKQYKQLLSALDVVTDEFKTSLSYFKTLYSLDPSAEYAKYLGDIYNRLDDKKKADYYYGLAGKE